MDLNPIEKLFVCFFCVTFALGSLAADRLESSGIYYGVLNQSDTEESLTAVLGGQLALEGPIAEKFAKSVDGETTANDCGRCGGSETKAQQGQYKCSMKFGKATSCYISTFSEQTAEALSSVLKESNRRSFGHLSCYDGQCNYSALSEIDFPAIIPNKICYRVFDTQEDSFSGRTMIRAQYNELPALGGGKKEVFLQLSNSHTDFNNISGLVNEARANDRLLCNAGRASGSVYLEAMDAKQIVPTPSAREAFCKEQETIFRDTHGGLKPAAEAQKFEEQASRLFQSCINSKDDSNPFEGATFVLE